MNILNMKKSLKLNKRPHHKRKTLHKKIYHNYRNKYMHDVKIKSKDVFGEVKKQYKNLLQQINSDDRPNLQRLFSKERIEKLKKMPESQKSYYEFAKILKKEFVQLKKNKKFQANNDFYDYVNYEWIEETGEKVKKNPKYYVQIDDFRITQDHVYQELIGYTEQYLRKNNDKKANAIRAISKCIPNANKSKGLQYIQNIKNQLDSLKEEDDLYGTLAFCNQNEIFSWQAPIVWSMLPDEKNVKKNISHISTGQLGLYDYFLYIDDPNDSEEKKKYKKECKEKYLEFIKKTFKTLLPNEWESYDPNDIWEVENQILEATGCEGKFKEDEDFYNKISRETLEKDMNFNWSKFARKLEKKYDMPGSKKENISGFTNIPNIIVSASPNSIKCTMDLLEKNWKTKQWKTYWLFIFLKQFLRFDLDWKEIYFDFYEKFLKGQPVQMPNELYKIFPLSFTFNTFLTKTYVAHNNDPLKEVYVSNMVEDLKYLFIHKIKKNTWLSPKTKRAAIDKLEKLTVVIGMPDKLGKDPLLNYKEDDPWYNMGLYAEWKREKLMKLENKRVIDIPEIDWNEFKLVGTQAYMVNAYYRPTSNSIYVPLAYLQKPFIDFDQRGIEYNLAYIGYTMGHELSHSLDDAGSRFDADGNLNNWWTKEDRAHYKKIIKDVINQYEEFAARDGIKFDASIGVGEDIADISGLSLVEEYLFYFQLLHNDISLIKNLSLEAFYIYGAIQSRQKIFDKALPAQLKQNPHPLEKYRCNCPLARLLIFRELFNVKKGDGMWWHNTNTIW